MRHLRITPSHDEVKTPTHNHKKKSEEGGGGGKYTLYD